MATTIPASVLTTFTDGWLQLPQFDRKPGIRSDSSIFQRFTLPAGRRELSFAGKLKVQPKFQKFSGRSDFSAELSKLREKIEIFRRKIRIVSGTPDVPAEIQNFSGKIKSSAGNFKVQRKIQFRRWKSKTSAEKPKLQRKIGISGGRLKSSAGK
jgi:hypothetical protein